LPGTAGIERKVAIETGKPPFAAWRAGNRP
jgi:hypothetical protein